MNKNTIWIIVGLMIAALIGISFLQAYWISNAIEIQRDQFDKDVYTALKLVAQELQENEVNEMNDLNNLLTISEKVTLDSKSKLTNPNLNFSGLGQQNEDISNHSTTFLKFRELKRPKTLGKRINPSFLKQLLEKQFSTRNINTDYDYQVYSIFKGIEPKLIINNGVYAATPTATSEVTEISTEIIELSKDEYPISIFDSAGKLVVSFPQRSRFILEKVLYPLIAAILFTAIVFSCFVYTIQVILKQKKVSEMKTDFVNNMTHEFKTPIATISLAVDSITSPMILDNQDKVKRFASIIKQENKRMLSQVEKVLQMALLDKKDFNLNLDFVDLHEVIEQAVTNSHLQAEKRGGSVTTNLKASKSRIEGDLTHLSLIHI